MECHEINQLLDALVDSQLEAEEREAVEEHLRACPACAKLREATLRVKRIVREKTEKPVPRADLKSRLAVHLRREGAGSSAGSGSTGGRIAKIGSIGVSKLAAAAAILIVATLSFFLFLEIGSPPEKLGHYAAAQGVRNVFLDHHDLLDPERHADNSRLRTFVEKELGVKFDEIDLPGGEFLGWRPETVAGHKAVRLDFRPDPNAALSNLGGDEPIVSVFLLSMESTEFRKDYIEALEEGHYCQGCIHYQDEGTIFCLRKNDLFVAAVSNVLHQSFDDFRVR